MDSIKNIQLALQEFSNERDWNKFHTPRNLALALAGEVGELAAEFQWIRDGQDEKTYLSNEKLNAIKLEIADVAIYLLRLSDVLGIDLEQAVFEKIEINSKRFIPGLNQF